MKGVSVVCTQLSFSIIVFALSTEGAPQADRRPGKPRYRVYQSQREKSAQTCNLVCHNGGQCYSDVVENVPPRCLCKIGYGGRMCEQSLRAELPLFSGFSFLELGSASSLLVKRKQFAINLKFIPYKLSGLILYIGSSGTEYAALSLVNGSIIFRFNCGAGSTEIQSYEELSLGVTVDVTLRLISNMGYLSVNNEQDIRGRAHGFVNSLDVRGNLFLGGHRDMSGISWQTRSERGFAGCILSMLHDGRKLDLSYKSGLLNIVAGLDIGNCASDVCNENLCRSSDSRCLPETPSSYRCLCPVGRSGASCERDEYIDDTSYISRFTGDSFLLYNSIPQPVNAFTRIIMSIKPVSGDGLLFYTGSAVAPDMDFLLVKLEGGQVVVSMDLGTGGVEVRSKNVLLLETWSEVIIERASQNVSLILNGVLVGSNQTTGDYIELNTNGEIYIGGHVDLDVTSPKAAITTMYEGCIHKVSVNGVPMLVKDAYSGMNVDSCSHACQTRGVCGELGRCVAEGDDFSCACPLHYSGPTCEDPVGAITTAYFKGSSYLMLQEDTVISSINSNRWDIGIILRATCTSCIILWIGQDMSILDGDYLFVALDDQGFPVVTFDLGGGQVTLKYDRLNITDGLQHHIGILRFDTDASMIVDGGMLEKFPEMLPNYKELNTNSGLYLGGYPPGLGITEYQPFRGCIELLSLSTVNSYPINPIKLAARGENIEQCEAGSS